MFFFARLVWICDADDRQEKANGYPQSQEKCLYFLDEAGPGEVFLSNAIKEKGYTCDVVPPGVKPYRMTLHACLLCNG